MMLDALEETVTRNLHLGCGHNRLEGWLNADLYPTPATDVTFDLQQPWPIETDSQCQVYASHVVEHLTDWQTFFQQAWRVLQPGGKLYLRVPYGGHPSAWWDFGHIRPWFIENFVFFQPGYSQQIGNPQHDGWQWPFQVDRIDVRIGEEVVKVLRWLPRWGRQLLLPYVRHSCMAIEELFIYMTPIKTLPDVQQWLALNHPTTLRCQYVCWAHQWQGRCLPPGMEPRLHTLGIAVHLNGYV